MSLFAQNIQQAATVAEEALLPLGRQLLQRAISALVPMGVDIGVAVVDPTQGLSRSTFTVDPFGTNAHEASFAHFKDELRRPIANISDIPESRENAKKREHSDESRNSLGLPWETRPSVPLMRELGATATKQPLMKF